MPTLPSSLALTNVADGALAVAADHRNNFTAIQTEANALLGILDDGVTGQFLKGVGTTVSYDYPPGYEYAYVEQTSNVTASGTEVAPVDVASAGAITFDGATTVIVEFFCESAQTAAAAASLVAVSLWDSATDMGRLAQVLSPASTAAAASSPVCARRRLTPSAGAHTYKIRCWQSGGNGTIVAGVGGVGAVLPAFIRITKA